jgi:hypothetical protein
MSHHSINSYYYDRSNNRLEEEDISIINDSNLIIVRTRKDDHLAYYNDNKKAYYLVCDEHFNAHHLSYSDFYDKKKGICYDCRHKYQCYKQDLKYKNKYENLLSEAVEWQKKVSIRCCVKTAKNKRCKFHSNTHGSFCKMHYDKLINIMSKRIPENIVMFIMNL